NGGWTYGAKPRIQTTYQARWAGGSSRPVTIGVRPLISVHELGNGRVWTRVVMGRSLKGRTVKLQRLVAGSGWQTVAEEPLDQRSTTVFAVSLPASIVRVAFSVNQAGKGFLGSVSHSLGYRAV